MNIQKPLACFLAAATCVSSLPNVKAENSNFGNVSNKIINSKEALYALGAFDLAAIIVGGVLLSRQKKADAIDSKQKPKQPIVPSVSVPGQIPPMLTHNRKTVKIRITDPSTGEHKAYKATSLIEYTIPNSQITIMLPPPYYVGTEVCPNGTPAVELKKELNELIANINNPNMKYKYIKLADTTTKDIRKLAMWGDPEPLNVDEYIAQVLRFVPSGRPRGAKPSSSAQPTQSSQSPLGEAPRPPLRPAKKITIEYTDAKGATRSVEGDSLFSISSAKVYVLLPDFAKNLDAQQMLGKINQGQLTEDFKNLAAKINDPNARFNYLKISDVPNDDITELLQSSHPQDWNADRYCGGWSGIQLNQALAGRRNVMEEHDDEEEETETQDDAPTSPEGQTYQALQRLVDDGYDGDNIPENTKFCIITLNGLENCKCRAYKIKNSATYYLLPYPEDTTAKPKNADHKIYGLAMAVSKMKSTDELNNILAQNDASMREISATGKPSEDKDSLRGLNVEFAAGQSCIECDSLSTYSDNITNYYISKIKKSLNQNAKSNINYYFYQLSADSTKLEPFNVDSIKDSDGLIGNNAIYVLPSTDTNQKHYLIAPDDQIRAFISGEHLPASNDYPKKGAFNLTNSFFKMIIAKNHNGNKPLASVDTIKAARPIANLPEYRAWQDELARRRKATEEEAKRKAAEEECEKRCQNKETMDKIKGYFVDTPPADAPAKPKPQKTAEPEPQEDSASQDVFSSAIPMPPQTMLVSHRGTRGNAAMPTIVNARRALFEMKAEESKGAAGKLTKVTVRHPTNVDRLVVSPDITLANGTKLELRGKKYIDTRDGVTSDGIMRDIQQLTLNKVSVIRLGNFLWDVAQHLDNQGVGIQKLEFVTVNPQQVKGKIEFSVDTDDRNLITCSLTSDYLLKGGFYDDWQEEAFKKDFTEHVKAVFRNRNRAKPPVKSMS